MNPILKKKLSILIRLAGIDGEFVQTEKNFILAIGQRHGASEAECLELIDRPESIGSLGALTYDKAVEYMSDCLSLMIIDRVVHPREVLLCEDIAMRLGFAKKEIDRLISRLSEHTDYPETKVRTLVRKLSHPAKG